MPKIIWIVVYGCLYNLPFFIQIDSLAGMASLSLGGSAAPHTQSMQGFPPNLGSAFSTPQSPAKAFPPLSTQNQTTGFSGIGGLSSQLPGTALRPEWFVSDTPEALLLLWLEILNVAAHSLRVGWVLPSLRVGICTGQTAVSYGKELFCYGVRSPHSWVTAETAPHRVAAAIGKRFEPRG